MSKPDPRPSPSDPARRAHLADGSIFWLVNLLAYIRHPYNVLLFRLKVGYFPNVARPLRYNEKMLWRKIFDHNPLFVTFTDKLATKVLISRICPKLRVAEVLWIGDDISKIPADVLERPIVIKVSHRSSMNFFPMAGGAGRDTPVDRINGWLGQVHGRAQRTQLEWAYGLAEGKLFAEELILPDKGEDLVDLSVHAADGAPMFIEAIIGNKAAHQRKGYFRTDGARWPELEQKRRRFGPGPSLPEDFRLPPSYAEALVHTGRLSAGVDYARFDFIAASDRLYAGEITVYPGSGLTRHADFPVYNAVVSDHWDLSKSWFLHSRHRGMRRRYAKALSRFLNCGGEQE
jgi:TupA-like ATPgrasp